MAHEIDVKVVGTLVARSKQVNGELDALRARVAEHEQAIQAVYAAGEPLAKEAREVSRQLRIALGLEESGQSQPDEG